MGEYHTLEPVRIALDSMRYWHHLDLPIYQTSWSKPLALQYPISHSACSSSHATVTYPQSHEAESPLGY